MKMPRRGYKQSIEHKTKSAIARTGRPYKPLTEEHKKKIGMSKIGKPRSEETKRKLRDAALIQFSNPDALIKASEVTTRYFTNPENRKAMSALIKSLGYRHDEGMRKLIGDSRRGYHHSQETKEKIRVAQQGALAKTWKGGISFAPYCQKFNNDFKERVRKFYDGCCVECGIEQGLIRHAVHHVNFNKQTCCDNTQPLFVLLCPSCHIKTNHNRIFWEYWFTEMIMRLYNGQCYLPKGVVM